jgi:hypothetical protein
MIIIKGWLIGVFISFVIMYAFDKLTNYLGDKPREHKFRQWWSKHVCDLDNNYN